MFENMEITRIVFRVNNSEFTSVYVDWTIQVG